MLNCRKVSELVAEGRESGLSPLLRFRIALHIILCPPCRAFARQMQLLKEWAGKIGAEPPDAADVLSPEAKARIKRALETK